MHISHSVYAVSNSLPLCWGQIGKTNLYLFLASNQINSGSPVTGGAGKPHQRPKVHLCTHTTHPKSHPKCRADPVPRSFTWVCDKQTLASHFELSAAVQLDQN